MNYSKLHFEADIRPAAHFRTGVSIHGHTLHSKESLDFVYKFARGFLPVRFALERGQARYGRTHGSPLDLARGWWTPPLSAHQAWQVEVDQITGMQMNPLVSLSDHDNIDAPMNLQFLEDSRATPVSVEWTVPFGGTFFHIGVHNIPGSSARRTMAALETFTANAASTESMGSNRTSGQTLYDLFSMLAAHPQVLIVFNHPNWDEKGIGEEAHRATARQFTSVYRSYLHAFELNGLRPWSENRTVLDLARAFGKPVISGGDRHAAEANTLLNLTNASTFAEFVEEVRDGISDVLITDQYLEPLPMRILQSLEEILSYREDHAYGWQTWRDRSFYMCDDGVTRSLHEIWGAEPLAMRLFATGVELLRNPQFKQAFRLAFAKREEVAF